MAISKEFTVWEDLPAEGAVNMATDELLAEATAATGGMAVRLYRWSQPTLSLGGFQKHGDAEPIVKQTGLAVVRRPSGGGAILHGTDLTYAVAVARGHPLAGAPQQLYDVFHQAMVAVLCEVGLSAGLVAAAAGNIGGSGESAPDGPLLCFDRRAIGDVVVGPHKVLGSAQRRLSGSILQHGSLLVGQCDQAGPGYTRPGLVELAAGTPDAEASLVGLAALCPPSRERAAAASSVGLVARWLERVAESQGLSVHHAGPFVNDQMQPRVAERAERFRSAVWLTRR
ncbi:MAG: lipoate--protein ligase family protein [Pirellulales bacterium]|jgi:lipoate-protein ligase A|nr:lipoate--protein ligase family protein [Pirellulales bacterium]